MKKEDYEKIHGLVSDIDKLSSSADLVSEISESISKNGGIAKIYTRTGGISYETELEPEILEVVFFTILGVYNDLIRETKNKVDYAIDSIIK